MYAVIVTIGSEENSVAFYLKSETDSYYFSLEIWNRITKEYPSNYASAICRHVVEFVAANSISLIINIIYACYLCEAGLSFYIGLLLV